MKLDWKGIVHPWARIGAVVGLAAVLHSPLVRAQDKPRSEDRPPPLEQLTKIRSDAYIVGPGDGFEIELVDLPELSGRFAIGPDGKLYLPRLRALHVEGLTVEELQTFLTEQFRTFVIDPQVYIRPVIYRPIRVYIGGEVKRPGYYTLSSDIELDRLIRPERARDMPLSEHSLLPYNDTPLRGDDGLRTTGALFPTVFDAIRTARGITPYSNISQVQVIRRQAMSQGEGRLSTQLNFLSLITEGDETQNIRLFDGDVVNVSKSPTMLREQLLQAVQTNLSPQFLQVFVSGRVEMPGAVSLPQGSSLVQAIDLAGGTKTLHGKVEFIRFTPKGEIDRRIFGLRRNARLGDYRNPVLMEGDVIRLRQTPVGKYIEVLEEVTTPIVRSYSIYSFFENFNN